MYGAISKNCFLLQTDTWNSLATIAGLCNRAEFKTGQGGVPILKRWEICSRQGQEKNFEFQFPSFHVHH